MPHPRSKWLCGFQGKITELRAGLPLGAANRLWQSDAHEARPLSWAWIAGYIQPRHLNQTTGSRPVTSIKSSARG